MVFVNEKQRRWLRSLLVPRALLCCAVVLAQLVLVSHFHSSEADEGLALHDCYSCTAAEHFDYSPPTTTNDVVVIDGQSVAAQRQSLTPFVKTFPLYLSRAPPHFIAV